MKWTVKYMYGHEDFSFIFFFVIVKEYVHIFYHKKVIICSTYSSFVTQKCLYDMKFSYYTYTCNTKCYVIKSIDSVS